MMIVRNQKELCHAPLGSHRKERFLAEISMRVKSAVTLEPALAGTVQEEEDNVKNSVDQIVANL